MGLYDVTNNKGSITSSSFHQSTVYALSFGPAQLGNTFSTSEVQNKDNDGPASDNVGSPKFMRQMMLSFLTCSFCNIWVEKYFCPKHVQFKYSNSCKGVQTEENENYIYFVRFLMFNLSFLFCSSAFEFIRWTIRILANLFNEREFKYLTWYF